MPLDVSHAILLLNGCTTTTFISAAAANVWFWRRGAPFTGDAESTMVITVPAAASRNATQLRLELAQGVQAPMRGAAYAISAPDYHGLAIWTAGKI